METVIRKRRGHFVKFMVAWQLGGDNGNVITFFLLYAAIFNSSCVIIAALKKDA